MCCFDFISFNKWKNVIWIECVCVYKTDEYSRCVDLGHFATLNNTLLHYLLYDVYMLLFLRKGRTTSAEPFLYSPRSNLQRWPLPFLTSFLFLFQLLFFKLLWLERRKEMKIDRFLLSKNIFKINMLGLRLCLCMFLLAPKGSFIMAWRGDCSNWMNEQQKILWLARCW